MKNPQSPVTYVPAVLLMLLPAVMGFVYIWFGVIYTNQLRLELFDLLWVVFAFSLIVVAAVSDADMGQIARGIPRNTLILLAVFLSVLAYTTLFSAIDNTAAMRITGTGLVAFIGGIAAAAIKSRYGNRFEQNLNRALFIAMILHIPFLIWLYALEGQNPGYRWSTGIPGFTGIRPYNYLVEVGIAAGAGLFVLHAKQKPVIKLALVVGVTLLWTALFWSGGRGGLAALVLTFIFAAIIVPRVAAILWGFVLVTGFTGAAITYFLPIPGTSFGLLGRAGAALDSATLNQLTTGRLNMWLESFDLFLQKPLFGHGISQYPFLTQMPGFHVHKHVHNLLIDSLLSFGIIGTLALMLLIGKIWGTAVLKLRAATTASSLPMFLIATTLLSHAFVSGTYFHVHSQIVLAIALAMLVQKSPDAKKI